MVQFYGAATLIPANNDHVLIQEWDVPAGLAKGQAESSAANLLVVHVFVSVKVS